MNQAVPFHTIPGLAFVKDLHSRFKNASLEFARQAGLSTGDDLMGLDDYAMPWAEFADQYRRDDAHVFQFGHLQKIEPFTNHHGAHSFVLVTKDVFYEDGNAAGIIATAQILSRSLQQQLHKLQAMDKRIRREKLPKYTLQPHYDKLTKRESEIFFLVIRYFSAKIIAKKLAISHRTVEKHIEMIKDKLDCHSKNDILDYADYNNLVEIIIPSH